MSSKKLTNHVPLHIAVHIMRAKVAGLGEKNPSVVVVRAWANGDRQRTWAMLQQLRATSQYLDERNKHRELGRAVLELRQSIERGSPEQIGKAYRKVAELADLKATIYL
jgi:hypothetical protein